MIFEKIYDMENLEEAWGWVRGNRPAPGIDRVRWEDFETNLSYNLQMLQNQIRDESYKPLPVSIFDHRKVSGKSRLVGVSTIRDRVVQQALRKVINPYFEKHFLPCSYAYRSGSSALSAVKKASQCIATGKLWLLQMDVEKYFDTMDHGILLDLIGRVLNEKPLVRLISKLLKARIFKEMGLFDNLIGTQQGSGLSPLLSNIYLHPVDKMLWERYQDSYLRYSDDLAVFAEEKEQLEKDHDFIVRCLAEMKLAANPQKTTITHVASGVVYLGFYLDASGRGPAQKSIESLQTKLGEYDKVRRTDDISEKLSEITTMVRGWYNYYKTLNPIRPGNTLSLIALVHLQRELGETNRAREMLKESKNFTHNHPEIAFQLAELFLSFGLHNQAMREYARALELDPSLERAKERVRDLQEGEGNLHQAIEKVQLLLHHNPHYREGYQKLAEYYTELGLFGFAEKAHQKVLELDDDVEGSTTADDRPEAEADAPSDHGFDFHTVDQELFLNIFMGRRDAHAKQWVDERGRWGFVRVDRPLKTRDIYAHLKGEQTVAVYPVTARDTVNFIVFDVDTARRVILESGNEDLEAFRQQAHQDILRIKTVCEQLGLTLYLEDSGYKGRHGWLFFAGEAPATQAMVAGREIMKRAGGPSEGLTWELFPMGKTQRHLSVIKLPLGVNRKNNRRCLFLNADGHPIADQGLLLRTLKRNDLATIKDFLDKCEAELPPADGIADSDDEQVKPASGIEGMVSGCKVVRHLMSKAKETNYLNHYERTCLLYTLSFAGDEGCRLLHKIISYCINYDYQYTQRQIDRRKESPISCARIMEHFPELAETLPCDCKFDLPPRSYPSPVLYLLKSEIESVSVGPRFTKTSVEKKAAPAAIPTPATPADKAPLLNFEDIFAAESTVEQEATSPEATTQDEGPSGQELAAESEPHSGETPSIDPWEKSEPDRPIAGVPAARLDLAPHEPLATVDVVSTEHPAEAVESQPPSPSVASFETASQSPSPAAEDKPDDRRTLGPAPVAPDLTGDGFVKNDQEVWEVMLEYLKMKHSEAKLRNDLEQASNRLEGHFAGLGTEMLKTTIGTIRRIKKADGKSHWIVTTDD